MRVLFLTHRLPYAPNRGDRIRAYHILRTLASEMEVDLVSLVHDDAEAAHAEHLTTLAARVTVVKVPRLRNLVRGLATLPTRRPLTHTLLDAPDMRRALRGLMTERPPDVVLAYGSGMARFALEPPLDAIPHVLDMVDVDSEKWAALGRCTPAPQRWIYATEARRLRRFEADASRHAYATLVVNERERTALRRIAPESNVRVLPIGVDRCMFRRPLAVPAEPHVIFCGVMNYRPNEEAAIWLARVVWPRVQARRADARLLLVGSSPSAAVRRLATADPSILVSGTVDDVRPFLWRSSVAVAPLSVARGVQTKVFEATAAGLPSVVTPQVLEGLPPEIAPACIVAHTPDAFAAAILDLIERPLADRQALAARATLDHLGWTEQLKPLIDILEQAVQSRH